MKDKQKTVNLVVGQVYFIVVYHDRDFTKPLIQTLTYKETINENGNKYIFNQVGYDEPLFVEEEGLEAIVYDLKGLIGELKKNLEAS